MSLPHEHHGNTDKILKSLPSGDNFLTVAGLLKLLCDPTRLQLFWILCHTEECIINLADILDVSSPAVSHHIKFLKDADLIISQKKGKEVYYKASSNDRSRLMHLTIEKIMKSACPTNNEHKCDNCEHKHTDEAMAEIHRYLLDNLDKRFTIEELSRKFLMNPTTLKLKFKSAYGCSIAAHIKEHRMEKAAKLLTETNASVSEIASLVGYSSHSKFTTAFSEAYGMSPLEFKKKYTR